MSLSEGRKAAACVTTSAMHSFSSVYSGHDSPEQTCIMANRTLYLNVK